MSRLLLTKRMEYFKEAGCCVSDHGLEYVAYADVTEDEVEAVFAKKMAGQELSREEIGKYKMGVLMHLGKEYHRLNWVMQLHYGVKRDNTARFLKPWDRMQVSTAFLPVHRSTNWLIS